jgi:hypothetical protein
MEAGLTGLFLGIFLERANEWAIGCCVFLNIAATAFQAVITAHAWRTLLFPDFAGGEDAGFLAVLTRCGAV